MSNLVNKGGRSFRCVGCNTLRMDIPYSVLEIAMAMENRGLSHLPECVLADDAYPRNTGREGSESEWKQVTDNWRGVVDIWNRITNFFKQEGSENAESR